MSESATLEELMALPARVAKLEQAIANWLPVPTQYWSPELTEREFEILPYIAAGWTNQEIADHFYISERTARTHVSDILSRLGAPNRTTVCLWALATEKVTIRHAVALMLHKRDHLLVPAEE